MMDRPVREGSDFLHGSFLQRPSVAHGQEVSAAAFAAAAVVAGFEAPPR
jgi:hypothetical protein